MFHRRRHISLVFNGNFCNFLQLKRRNKQPRKIEVSSKHLHDETWSFSCWTEERQHTWTKQCANPEKTRKFLTLKTYCMTDIRIDPIKNRNNWGIKKQLDATYYFIVLLIGSTCFGHYYAYHQELATIMLITTLVVSFLVCCRLEVRCG